MKKATDLLLVLALLIAIGLLVYFQPKEDGRAAQSSATETSTLSSKPTVAHASSPSPTTAPTSTPSPTLMATRTPTSTSTPKPTSTPRFTSTTKATLTLEPTQSPVDKEIKDNIERGNQIIQAIETYYQAKSFYPPLLDDLIPDYLPRIPQTSTGQPFFYRVFDRTSIMSPEIYWVSFRVVSQDHVTCTYYRKIQYWDCNTASP